MKFTSVKSFLYQRMSLDLTLKHLSDLISVTTEHKKYAANEPESLRKRQNTDEGDEIIEIRESHC